MVSAVSASVPRCACSPRPSSGASNSGGPPCRPLAGPVVDQADAAPATWRTHRDLRPVPVVSPAHVALRVGPQGHAPGGRAHRHVAHVRVVPRKRNELVVHPCRIVPHGWNELAVHPCRIVPHGWNELAVHPCRIVPHGWNDLDSSLPERATRPLRWRLISPPVPRPARPCPAQPRTLTPPSRAPPRTGSRTARSRSPASRGAARGSPAPGSGPRS
jgi:hypothetical protein